MKKQKKNMVYKTEEQKEIMQFGIVLLVVVVCILGVYFFSKAFVMDKSLFEVSYNPGVVNYERVIVGTMFNRPEKDYYVIAYDESSNSAPYYSAISSKYTTESKNALKVYHLDLDNSLNKDFLIKDGEKSNSKATKPSEVKLGDFTLIKIQNGKIIKYLENISDIEKELTVKS